MKLRIFTSSLGDSSEQKGLRSGAVLPLLLKMLPMDMLLVGLQILRSPLRTELESAYSQHSQVVRIRTDIQ